jgi:hypothetical protein
MTVNEFFFWIGQMPVKDLLMYGFFWLVCAPVGLALLLDWS